jgi:hypothetical protein
LTDFCPAHFRGADQAFDAGLKFDERAVIHHPDDFALDLPPAGYFSAALTPGSGDSCLRPTKRAVFPYRISE